MKTNNTITRKVIVALVGIAISGTVAAQQTPLSNFYNFNEYLLNPAEAGANNFIEGTASHRIQWQGIEGAPRTTFFGVHGALNEKMGVGAKIDVDQTDILKQFNAALSYSYKVMINEKAKLHFGVSGMMVQNSVGYNDAVVGDLADEVVNGGDESGIAFDAEAGVMLEYAKFKLGIASRNLFESSVSYTLPDDRGDGTFDRIRQFRAYGSYLFGVSENWTVEPFVMVRNQGVQSFQFEVNALTTWKETLYLGAGYRQEAGLIGRVGFQVTDQIVAAYAYEFSPTGIASYSGGSHEFMLGYKIGKRVKREPKVAEVPVPVAPKKVVEEKVVELIVKEVVEAPKKVIEEIKEAEKNVPPTPAVAVVKPKETPKEEPVVEKETIDESIFDKKIVFSFEGTNIPEFIKKDLDLIAKELVAHASQRVRIKGHTCDMGNDVVNTTYSNRRANTVKNYLLKKGVKANQMEIKAVLDREPLVPNTSLENRKKNRRAEIELIR